MNILDKFLNSIRLNDDFDDDDEFFDDEDDFEEEKPKRRFSKKFDDDFDDDDDDFDDIRTEKKTEKKASEKKYEKQPKTASKSYGSTKTEKQPTSSKITPMRNKKSSSTSGMEVCVVKPSSMDETREIADTLLDRCTVVLNLEGIDVDIAQRIIDFSSGACYALDGRLQKISSYIFILTPANVEISGDFQEILSGSFDVSSVRKSF